MREDLPENAIVPLDQLLEKVEYEAITQALSYCLGNQSEAARRLQISRTTLRTKLAQYEKSDRQMDGN